MSTPAIEYAEWRLAEARASIHPGREARIAHADAILAKLTGGAE